MKTILIAEDDEDDFFFTSRALRKAFQANLIRAENGREAIEYLAGNGRYSDRGLFPFPDLVLLDLKMDEIDGHGVLAWIREHLAPSEINLFVLTGSGEARDRALVKSSGMARGYLVKPLAQHDVGAVLALGSVPAIR